MFVLLFSYPMPIESSLCACVKSTKGYDHIQNDMHYTTYFVRFLKKLDISSYNIDAH